MTHETRTYTVTIALDYEGPADPQRWPPPWDLLDLDPFDTWLKRLDRQRLAASVTPHIVEVCA